MQCWIYLIYLVTIAALAGLPIFSSSGESMVEVCDLTPQGHMERTSKCQCLGLAVEWEKIDSLRERIRNDKKILLHEVGESFCVPHRPNAVRNAMVLEPLLARLGKTKDWKLPHLDDLQIEVRTLYEKSGLNPGEKGPYRTTVELKKLAGAEDDMHRRQELRELIAKKKAELLQQAAAKKSTENGGDLGSKSEDAPDKPAPTSHEKAAAPAKGFKPLPDAPALDNAETQPMVDESQIAAAAVPPVLTRRDQLKLKEEKERARKEKSVAKENAKDDKIQKGEVVKKKTRKPRAKKLSKLDENAAEGDESVKPIAEPEAVEPALGDTHDATRMNAESGNEQDEENIKTPKKMLFQSDEEDGDEKCKAGDCKEDRIADAKTGELKKLSEIYNEDAPKQWDKSKPQKRLKSASAASTLPANESKRRKKTASKDETRIMQGGPEACPQVQGICIQHMKAVQGLTYDEMKDYLADSIEKDFFNFKLDPYKTRSACGLQAHLVRKDKKTEIAYFRFSLQPTKECRLSGRSLCLSLDGMGQSAWARIAVVGHQLTMPSLRGNRWAVKLGLLEDDSSELAMF
ncbi:unnamed protein product [Cladocopium goreaui]|uniref:Uncharacterized protein n=1 Tax=Cladocopium goreaui TaxID=2562237 RepID=A0A9P1CBL1_9DINO|nr:unnamed protein product [Cladocopium goreaui]